MSQSYDTKCYDLAAAFLDDVPKATVQDMSELAGSIQLLIDTFLTEVEGREKPQSKETT